MHVSDRLAELSCTLTTKAVKFGVIYREIGWILINFVNYAASVADCGSIYYKDR